MQSPHELAEHSHGLSAIFPHKLQLQQQFHHDRGSTSLLHETPKPQYDALKVRQIGTNSEDRRPSFMKEILETAQNVFIRLHR